MDITVDSLNKNGLLTEILNMLPILFTDHKQYSRSRQFMVESFIDIIHGREEVESKSNGISFIDNKILCQISNSFARNLSPILSKTEDEEIVRSICHLICNYCYICIEFISAVNIASTANLQLIHMILYCTKHSSTMICEKTIDFWQHLLDIPAERRHPSLKKNVYSQVLRCLLLHASDASEFDQHSRFRRNTEELFVDIYILLREEFFLQIQSILKGIFLALILY